MALAARHVSPARAAVRAALGTALSRGPGYEPTPPGQAFADDRVCGYFLDFSAKTRARASAEPEMLRPAALAQLALGWWERLLTRDEQASERFLAMCRLLRAQAEDHGEELRWPYGIRVPKFGLEPPWYSALAQGQIASVFVRAYLLTDGGEYAELARRAAIPLTDRRSDLVSHDDGPALEEAPSSPASRILNGWIFALWGLRDVHVGLDDARAGEMWTESVGTLRRTLGRYDVGWWTRYSLYPLPRDDLAKPFYHALHVSQVEILHRLTGFPEFAEAASRWAHYDHRAARLRVLAQKAVVAGTRALGAP